MRWDVGRTVTYEARRVVWGELAEKETLGNATGGDLSISSLSSTKESGSVEFSGWEDVDPYNLIRVYAHFANQLGETESVPLFTHMIESYSFEKTPAGSSGKVETCSVLNVLDSEQIGYPMTIPKGTEAIQYARGICEYRGLMVVGGESNYTLSVDHSFKEDDTYLTVVNWLLDTAGYGSADVTRNGEVLFAPYVEPSARPISYTFEAGECSILEPKVTVSNDWMEMPNTCRMYYSSDDLAITLEALNVDPLSPASIPNRQRYVVLFESVNELAAKTLAEKKKELGEKAKQKLLDNSSEIEYCEFSHAFCNVWGNDAVNVAPAAFSGTVTALDITLDAQTTCKTKARRFIRTDIEIEVTEGVVWQS